MYRGFPEPGPYPWLKWNRIIQNSNFHGEIWSTENFRSCSLCFSSHVYFPRGTSWGSQGPWGWDQPYADISSVVRLHPHHWLLINDKSRSTNPLNVTAVKESTTLLRILRSFIYCISSIHESLPCSGLLKQMFRTEIDGSGFWWLLIIHFSISAMRFGLSVRTYGKVGVRKKLSVIPETSTHVSFLGFF